MKNFKKVFLYILLANYLYATNNNPIFLLHGFMGWGREELKNYYYWGGKYDLEKYLIDSGYNVYTLSVGPVSSNWDRAIEVFYQIKGGQVNYGKVHSDKYNLIQKPETRYYDGLYPEWDDKNPIHIIGHSQGGQTARMLEYILKNNFSHEDSELLQQKYYGWIQSVSTISTPHNGTTLAPIINNMFPYIQSMVIWFEIIAPNNIYDLDLDQWGFYKNKNEDLYGYIKRLRKSPISTTNNFCSYDLSLEGADYFNKLYETDSLTYYFSYSTTNNNDPRLIYTIQSNLIKNSNNYPIEWRENDGIVNTISMPGPNNTKVKEYNGVAVKGIWQHIGKINLDHNEIIGHHIDDQKIDFVKKIYLKHCKLIATLN